ncbi:TetR/AcrR family transcriptional regulator [Phenylobacterium sp.]|uniref:TetR/AcrR family transcriptional regulator n=1 Tax=Phenylobacterium sp. TaxID=1871053 RepID=UPI00374D53F9
MATARGYHHGDLKAALIRGALAAVETGGPDAVSLRDLAQSLGVSTAAPYRHFPDRRALLAEVAAIGFNDLTAAYARAQAEAADPVAAMRETARAYLTLAFGRPGLFKLMFASDIVDGEAPASLLGPAQAAWEGLFRAVAAAEPGAEPAAIKRRAITGWSTLHGFITLVQGGRLKGFMTEPLTEADLLEAILDKTLREA